MVLDNKMTSPIGSRAVHKYGGWLIFFQGSLLASIALATTAVAGATVVAGDRTREWYKNSHFIGETYPPKEEVRRRLGEPNQEVEFAFPGVRVTGRYKLIHCGAPSLGTKLVGWFYSFDSEKIGVWIFFEDSKMVCFSGRTSLDALKEWNHP